MLSKVWEPCFFQLHLTSLNEESAGPGTCGHSHLDHNHLPFRPCSRWFGLQNLLPKWLSLILPAGSVWPVSRPILPEATSLPVWDLWDRKVASCSCLQGTWTEVACRLEYPQVCMWGQGRRGREARQRRGNGSPCSYTTLFQHRTPSSSRILHLKSSFSGQHEGVFVKAGE